MQNISVVNQSVMSVDNSENPAEKENEVAVNIPLFQEEREQEEGKLGPTNTTQYLSPVKHHNVSEPAKKEDGGAKKKGPK